MKKVGGGGGKSWVWGSHVKCELERGTEGDVKDVVRKESGAEEEYYETRGVGGR